MTRQTIQLTDPLRNSRNQARTPTQSVTGNSKERTQKSTLTCGEYQSQKSKFV